MQDFTLTTYKKLIQELLTNGYSFQTFHDFIQQPENKTVILRHDVDLAYRSQRSEGGDQKSEIHRLRRLPQYHLPELPMYDLPDLPQYDLPDLRGRRGKRRLRRLR